MKKYFGLLLAGLLVVSFNSMAYGFSEKIESVCLRNQEPVVPESSSNPLPQEPQKGGLVPCLVSCFYGPRIGLELNEGKSVEPMELIYFLGGPFTLYASWELAGKTNGANGCFASCCLGPRVGSQLHERKIRTMEWLQLIGIGTIIIAYEAYSGKTMIEIEEAENLRR